MTKHSLNRVSIEEIPARKKVEWKAHPYTLTGTKVDSGMLKIKATEDYEGVEILIDIDNLQRFVDTCSDELLTDNDWDD